MYLKVPNNDREVQSSPPIDEVAWRASSHQSLSVIGLFAGVGGLELGLQMHGHESVMLCEADVRARQVLESRFAKIDLTDDVRELKSLPSCDVLTAGFPCQDLSQVGRRKGIDGPNSGLIDLVFELLGKAQPGPSWVILENVPFMLSLDRGRAIAKIADALEAMGFSWAYRTVDARAFGLPQRRRRVIILASRRHDPRGHLLAQDGEAPTPPPRGAHACGFYWTEGNTGLGWAVDATPPLKGGSALHIPSPPAIWFPRRRLIGTPTIEDAERLQGFSAGWTEVEGEDRRSHRQRWRLVGNAVSVPMAGWIAERLRATDGYDDTSDAALGNGAWPRAAWGVGGKRGKSNASEWPVTSKPQHLAAFLGRRVNPLSTRAAAGFLSRLRKSSLRYEEAFAADLEHHIAEYAAPEPR